MLVIQPNWATSRKRTYREPSRTSQMGCFATVCFRDGNGGTGHSAQDAFLHAIAEDDLLPQTHDIAPSSSPAASDRTAAPELALDSERIVVTRQALQDGSLLAAARQRMLPGSVLRSDVEIEADLDAALAHRPASQDVWLFGYPIMHT